MNIKYFIVCKVKFSKNMDIPEAVFYFVCIIFNRPKNTKGLSINPEEADINIICVI